MQQAAQSYVITDLDHTLSDASWRDALIGRWEEYYRAADGDEPLPHVAAVIKAMVVTGHFVCIVTGRPEDHRHATLRWLIHHCLPIDLLLMRPPDDFRPAREVKCDLVRTAFPDLTQIKLVLEDRDDAVAAYIQMGLPVLQVRR